MPDTIDHPYLGTLSRTDGGIDYVGSRPIANRKIRVAVVVEVDPLPDILTRAEASLKHLESKHKECARYAATHLLDTHNQSWNEGDPIDADEFQSRITLDEITIYHDGGAEVFFRDGNLFAGHVIIVSIEADLTLSDASIAG